MSKEKVLTLAVGMGRRFGLGFCIDRYSINIDFLCFWIAIEL